MHAFHTYIQRPGDIDVAIGLDGDSQLFIIDVEQVVRHERDAMLGFVVRAVQLSFE